MLKALKEGSEALDMKSQDKTKSILRCIEYSHSNLSEQAQAVLQCLAPFTKVVNKNVLPNYIEHLKAQPALSNIPFDNWEKVIDEAINWGLITHDRNLPFMLLLQPIFPFFLKNRLAKKGQEETRAAINTAFRLHYDGLGDAIGDLLNSKEPQEKLIGRELARMEYENLVTGLTFMLEAEASVYNAFDALDEYLDTVQDHRRGLELGQFVLDGLNQYSAKKKEKLSYDIVRILWLIAQRQLYLKQYKDAEVTYKKALESLNITKGISKETHGKSKAGLFHQLGWVSQDQRKYEEAEEYYKKALNIYIEFNDRYEQASTYHQLGMVSQEQRKYEEAEEYYKKALNIKIEFHDRYSQASTYAQLGLLAKEKKLLKESGGYFIQAIERYKEFGDDYMLKRALTDFAEIYRDSQDAELLARTAEALSVSVEESEGVLKGLLEGQD